MRFWNSVHFTGIKFCAGGASQLMIFMNLFAILNFYKN